MAPIRVESDFVITIEKQATWNTAVDSAPIGLPSADLIITMEADKHIIPRDRGVRYAHEADSFHDTSATFPTSKLSFPVTSNILKNVLGGLLQSNPAWSPTTNVYDMYPVASSAIPLMGATAASSLSSEGYFYTLTKKSPTASLTERITNAVPRSMSLSLHPTDNYGVLWCDMEFVGTTYTATANPSGSVTQEALTSTLIYPWGGLDYVTYDGTSLFSDFVSFNLDMTWNAQLASGNPRGYMIFPKFEATATVTAGQNAALATAKGYLRSQAVSTGRPLVLTWGDGSSDPNAAGEMIITCFGRVDSFDDNDRAEGEVMTMGLACEQGAGGTEYPVRFQFYAA